MVPKTIDLTKVKSRAFSVLEGKNPSDPTTRFIQLFILGLISLNLILLILESVESVYSAWRGAFHIFEVVSVLIFTVEYFLRIWSCNSDPRYSGRRGRVRFAFTPLTLVDAIAIVPFYLPFVSADLLFLRTFRLFRSFRVLKLGRYSAAMRKIGGILRSKKEELGTIIFIMMIFLLVASSLMYVVEGPHQPDKFSSIPASMWWAVVTLTTVGYGDVYPITPLGKVLGSVIALFGIGLFALPAGLLGGAFMEQVEKERRAAPTCPHCGKELE